MLPRVLLSWILAVTSILLAAAAPWAVTVPLPCPGNNCTQAINAALASCASYDSCTVSLQPGDYLLSGASAGQRIAVQGGLSNVVVQGAGQGATRLLLDDVATAIYIAGCSNMTFANFAIDSVRLPFTYARVASLGTTAGSPVGVVLEVNTTSGEYDFSPAAQARWPWLLQAQGLLSFDPVNRRIPPGATDIYALPPHALPVVVSGSPSGGLVNISLPTVPQGTLRVGDAVILRHVIYGSTSLEAHRGSGFTVQNVSLRSGAGMGVYGSFQRDISIAGLRIERVNGRPMSINADGVHFINCRGGPFSLRDSLLEGQGDDGLNVATTYVDIEDMGPSPDGSATTLRLGRWGSILPEGLLPLAANDTLVFLHRSDMTEVGRAVVASVSNRNGNVTLTGRIPSGVALLDLAYSLQSEADSVAVQRNTFTCNRARGSLLKARNLVASDNVYNFTSGPAAQAIPDGCDWFEGITLWNWTFANNSVRGGNWGGDAKPAMIYVASNAPIYVNGTPSDKACVVPCPAQPLHVGVTVRGNTFTTGAASGGAFSVVSAEGVLVADNVVQYEATGDMPSFDFNATAVLNASVSSNTCAGRPGGSCIVIGF